MAISEEARNELYRALERTIGHQQAGTLMGGLAFDDRFDSRFAAIDARFERLSGQMDRQFGEVQRQFGEVDKRFGEINERFGEVHLRIAEWGRTIVLANVATMVAAVSLAFAASRL